MKKISIFTFIGLFLGILFGLLFPSFMNEISFMGTIYINLLKFMIVPILFTTVMVSAYNGTNSKGKIVIKSVVLFIIMFTLTFLLSSLIIKLINPTKGFTYELIKWDGEITNIKISDVIINLFPSNSITMFQNNMIFPTIIFSYLCGICASKVKDGKKVIDIIDIIKNIFYKILEYIMYLTPIAVFSLIGTTIASYGVSIINVGAKYILVAYLCSIITLIVIMILPVWIFAKINPITYIKKIYKVWIITLTTCSSAATLPYTIKVCNEKLGIDKKITDIVVPLGCTIHMCGGAVSFALLGLFCSSLFGIDINITNYLFMLIVSLLINMAAPGIPNGGIIIGATYLSMFNIPLTFMGFYSSIYKLLDMAYTTLNVTGDITANVLINRYTK